MNPRDLSIRDYDYFLPEDRIAYYPSAERTDSKLLIYDEGKICEQAFANLADYIPENSLLIFNDSKVMEARVLFQKSSGGTIEIFCLEPDPSYQSIAQALLQTEKVVWNCLVGGASKWKHGQALQKKFSIREVDVLLHAVIAGKAKEHFVIEFSWSPTGYPFYEIIHAAGTVPLPPYIKRDPIDSDVDRYQTTYAKHLGSVAAPTAGLHFTEPLFEKLRLKNIHSDFVTLHVNAGTFKPVKSQKMGDHEMHAESIEVSRSVIEGLRSNSQNNILAVGTTAFRTMESVYWIGVKIKRNPSILPSDIGLSQWEVYDMNSSAVSVTESLSTILDWMDRHHLSRIITTTRILIAPGYQSMMTNGLLTNFHQPHSTLLLLVAAFIGEDWRKVYDFAMNNSFRFLSYGDTSLLWRRKITNA